MVVLPLYESPVHADASHRVAAPGGYEWWRFEAIDPPAQLRVTAAFCEGWIHHPDYLRRYARYRRHPTRHAPPRARDYPCVLAAVEQAGATLGRFLQHPPPQACVASAILPSVRMGGNAFHLRTTGELSLALRGQTRRGEAMAVDLTFAPAPGSSPPIEGDCLWRAAHRGVHRWIIPAPLSTVTGAVCIGGEKGGRVIEVNGIGLRRHHYGTSPLGLDLRHWIQGSTLLDGRLIDFCCAVPRDRALPTEAHVMEFDAASMIERSVTNCEVQWPRRWARRSKLPAAMRLVWKGGGIVLNHPRLIESDRNWTWAAYAAAANGKPAQASCHISRVR